MDRDTALIMRFELRRSCEALARGDGGATALARRDASRNTVLHEASRRLPDDALRAVFHKRHQVPLGAPDGVALQPHPEALSAFDVRARNAHGETALHLAARRGRASAVRELLEVGRAQLAAAELQRWLDTREWSGRMYTALFFAVASGCTSCVALLLDAGADPALLDSGGLSPAVLAANKQRHLLPLFSRDWFAQPWAPHLHARWPASFAQDALLALLVMRRGRLSSRDVRLLVLRAIGELYRDKRLQRVKKVTPV